MKGWHVLAVWAFITLAMNLLCDRSTAVWGDMADFKNAVAMNKIGYHAGHYELGVACDCDSLPMRRWY